MGVEGVLGGRGGLTVSTVYSPPLRRGLSLPAKPEFKKCLGILPLSSVSRFRFPSPVCRLQSPVSRLLSPVSCLPPPVSRLLSPVSCLPPSVSCFPSVVPCLLSPFFCLMSPVSRPLSPVSRLPCCKCFRFTVIDDNNSDHCIKWTSCIVQSVLDLDLKFGVNPLIT